MPRFMQQSGTHIAACRKSAVRRCCSASASFCGTSITRFFIWSTPKFDGNIGFKHSSCVSNLALYHRGVGAADTLPAPG